MDIDDMALIGPGVNLSEIPPINQKRTLAFVNTFITNTVTILNNLARTSELKLHKFEEKLQRMDASLCILEAKLASIPGLETVPVELPKVEQNQVAAVTGVTAPQESPKQEDANVSEAEPQGVAAVLAEPDPQYTKFFKMVQFGVPPQAVKLKMISEGLDPNILEDI
ncbi:WASH complex subunit 3 [Neocloeon triangulifer]|uniref:WASH complex subunit 3 n=1 Tax=Neocloeon triangulifer TaxID=2078957 RepID=UPI00286F6D74|nr:WASH complex subunit 3 [Neocloeon triangulifer]